jgi:hypothetical protein
MRVLAEQLSQLQSYRSGSSGTQRQSKRKFEQRMDSLNEDEVPLETEEDDVFKTFEDDEEEDVEERVKKFLDSLENEDEDQLLEKLEELGRMNKNTNLRVKFTDKVQKPSGENKTYTLPSPELKRRSVN